MPAWLCGRSGEACNQERSIFGFSLYLLPSASPVPAQFGELDCQGWNRGGRERLPGVVAPCGGALDQVGIRSLPQGAVGQLILPSLTLFTCMSFIRCRRRCTWKWLSPSSAPQPPADPPAPLSVPSGNPLRTDPEISFLALSLVVPCERTKLHSPCSCQF